MQSLKEFRAILNQTFIFLFQIQIASLGLLDLPTSNIVCYLVIDQRWTSFEQLSQGYYYDGVDAKQN